MAGESIQSLYRSQSVPETASRQHLRRLVVLRWLAVAGQLATLVGSGWLLGVQLPLAPLAVALVALAAFNLVSLYRLHSGARVGERELFAQFTVDVLVFTALVYYTGGTQNPFVFMFLLPATVAAVALPPRLAAFLTVLSLAGFTLVAFDHFPLALPHPEPRRTELMTLALWVNYALTAGLITYFVARIAADLREHQRLLARAREQELSNRYVVAVGSVAAGAARRLSGPLHRIAVSAGELEEEFRAAPELAGRLSAIRREIEACEAGLVNVLASVQNPEGKAAR